MSKIANKQMICEVLMEAAKTDKDIVALCSDSRGSGSFTPFAETYPDQFVETGIAEQNLVSISAGLAKCGKKSYAVSPACFLSTRSYEQAKVDVAYSNTNVKLIGISGGVSYGALGMSHHSAQDIAAMSAIPNMRVYLPSDRFQTAKLIEASLIYAFQKKLTFDHWYSLIVQIREFESSGSYDGFLINGFNGSYSAFPLARMENYVQMNSCFYAETMYTLQRTLTVEKDLGRLGENQEFVSYMCENIRMFCDGREKSRYYICKYFLFYLNTRIKYYMASDKNRRIKRNIYLDLPLSNISKMDPNRHAHMSEEEIKECLATAKISPNKLFELLNRFYSYILLSDSDANDPNWEEYSFMHRILQGDCISRSLLLLMILFFGSEAELPDPGLILTVRRMNEILQACRFQVLDESAEEDSLDSFLIAVLCSDDKKSAINRMIGQMNLMQ